MRISLDGKEVCSICWSDWESYRGFYGDEPVQCGFCGAGATEEPTLSLDISDLTDPEDAYDDPYEITIDDIRPIVPNRAKLGGSF